MTSLFQSHSLRIFFFLFIFSQFIKAQDQASSKSSGLILTEEGLKKIKDNLGQVPLFDRSLQEIKDEVDIEINNGIEVPIPKDLAGGYTHERHKKNYSTAQKAGVLFNILGEEKYANYIKKMLLEYAAMYPKLPLHPEERSYARGKIFWQSLNDSNWLVSMSQAYSSIYNWISKEERATLENNLFKPFADFLSVESPQFFNRIHNHSTWGNAAVGMIGLVMNDEELVDLALYGLKEDNIDETARDNDGGLIKQKGQAAGFLANMEEAFSPSGYYTEGPYYQRYALYPFMLFAKALQNKKPELKIFEYKDGILVKSVYALINLTDADGEFFPLNDAQKGMSYFNNSVIMSVDAAYYYGEHNPMLLSIAKKQGEVTLDDAGLAVALGLKNKEEQEFLKESIILTDGSKGNKGGVAILHSKEDKSRYSLVMKYTSQGDSHGHYDKLSYSFYNDGEEVIQDYGFARFVNIEQKNGGGYLKENTSWAKQSIAHNTIIQNETSHFNGDFDTGTKFHSEKYFSDFSKPDVQIISAKENNAYPGTQMHRTMALINSDIFQKPVMIDIFRVTGAKENQYDLPFYYFGQIIETNFEYNSPEKLEKLGSKNGYQHLWKEAAGISSANNSKFTWSNNNKFYTLTNVTKEGDSLIMARLGASDPQFNLRRDPVYIWRKHKAKDAVFVSVLEPHGSYNPITELGNNSFSQIKEAKILIDNDEYTAVELIGFNKTKLLLVIANKNGEGRHSLRINNNEISWKGNYTIIEN
ncbi:alginate lyase [Gillisia mitskevichiae]|uniref:Alginate lyase n=1 Tax=Gillisia mitskevichiae TaxID=270921 RepID=A0A495PYQ7_9FLAO|nr:heparinase II/III family protein [Gillisia mitskevichiae]RKS55706.1 alginate lyase [Gillisia mitskevichiae]